MNYSKITDWEHLRRRYLAFWNNQVEGNAIIAHIQNPNPTASKIPPESWMSEASESKYLNPEKLYRLKQWRRSFWNWHDGCAQHLDNILLENKIDLIQFGHDPNTGSFRNFLGHMRKIQDAGKKLFISCIEAEDVEFFIKNLDPRGLVMIINTRDDDESARTKDNVVVWTENRLKEIWRNINEPNGLDY